MRRRDLWIAPLCEGTLILIVGLAAWLSGQVLLFASLGPTAYEQIETPDRPSARPYNVIAGHLIGILIGFAVLHFTRAWVTPGATSGRLSLLRIEAAALSAALTVLCTLLARAQQPAAVATTLLISLGIMQRWQDGFIMMGAVLLMTLAGEPMRRWRIRNIERHALAKEEDQRQRLSR